MRHLVEVMLVLEGKQQWARTLRDRRSEQGLSLQLPSVSFDDGSGGDSGAELVALLRAMVEGMDKELVRLIVSFI